MKKFQCRPFYSSHNLHYLGDAKPFVIEAESQKEAETIALEAFKKRPSFFPTDTTKHDISRFVVEFEEELARIGHSNGPVQMVVTWPNGPFNESPGQKKWPKNTYNI